MKQTLRLMRMQIWFWKKNKSLVIVPLSYRAKAEDLKLDERTMTYSFQHKKVHESDELDASLYFFIENDCKKITFDEINLVIGGLSNIPLR